MLHCANSVATTARLDTATTILEGKVAPGILTAKTLQGVLQTARQYNIQHDEGPCDAILSPYGRMPRLARKARSKHRSIDSTPCQGGLRLKQDVVVRRKRCRKLDPIPAEVVRPQGNSNAIVSPRGNQTSGEMCLRAPDEEQLGLLRLGLQHTNTQLQRDADRLKTQIQWIHGHLPVLKLANAKCSHPLRQQLFKNAVVRVGINFILRQALMLWYAKLLEAQRKERLQLSASRRLIAMFEKLSIDRVAGRFNCWWQWVLECQSDEEMAAVITLQRFAQFLRYRREERESAAKQDALMLTLRELARNARVIQRAYRSHRRAVQHRRCEAAARTIQRVELRRTAHNGFVKRHNAAKVLQQAYRSYSKRQSRKRAQAIADLFDRSCERQARRIQSVWASYKTWRDNELPLEVVRYIVDQVEFTDAVLLIQHHLRGFQCRLRKRRTHFTATRIQNCWRATNLRVAARTERRMMMLRRELAASCLQRTFRRMQDKRRIRSVVRESTRPLYLRARHLEESFREKFRVPIAKSAIVVIQTTWRWYIACKNDKQHKLSAAITIQKFLRRWEVLSKWHNSVFRARRRRPDTAARALQRWTRRLHSRQTILASRRTSVVLVLEQISAAATIQRWYRHLCHDSWRFLSRLLAQELPRCNRAANMIERCWKAYSARKHEHMRRASTLAELIERQRCTDIENRAARPIQRMFKRMIDKRVGKLLLRRYKILLREDLKRREQRVIVHKFLEEKSQQRTKKQGTKATTLAVRQLSLKSSSSSPQVLSLDSNSTEASAFSLDGGSTHTIDGGWQEELQWSTSPHNDSPVQYWSEEYQRSYLYDPVTGISTWL